MKKYADKKLRPEAHESAYCPLELYSSDPERVKKAVYALWDDWIQSSGTINNLRVFANGRVLDPSEASTISPSHSPKMSSVLIDSQFYVAQKSTPEILAAQIDPDHTFPSHTLSSDLRTKFAETISLMLMDHPVLAKLSQTQRALDPLDIEGLSTLVSGEAAANYPNQPLPLLHAPEDLAGEDPTLDEWRKFLNAHFHHKFEGDPFNSPTNFKAFTHGMSQKRYYLLAYLLSASFKDCSIIIRGHEDNVKSASVTIIDLDSKSLKRMAKWEQLDRDVVRCTLEAEEGVEETEKRVCVEDSGPSSKRIL